MFLYLSVILSTEWRGRWLHGEGSAPGMGGKMRFCMEGCLHGGGSAWREIHLQRGLHGGRVCMEGDLPKFIFIFRQPPSDI